MDCRPSRPTGHFTESADGQTLGLGRTGHTLGLMALLPTDGMIRLEASVSYTHALSALGLSLKR